MEYYVYENWTHKKAIIHKSSCGYCNEGKGIHINSSDKNGRWLGPFKSHREAKTVAFKTNRDEVHACSYCSRQ